MPFAGSTGNQDRYLMSPSIRHRTDPLHSVVATDWPAAPPQIRSRNAQVAIEFAADPVAGAILILP